MLNSIVFFNQFFIIKHHTDLCSMKHNTDLLFSLNIYADCILET